MVAVMSDRSTERRTKTWGALAILLLVVGLATVPNARAGQSIAVAWNANSETNLAGYRLFFGAVSRNYEGMLEVPVPETSATFTNLLPGATYFFSLIAFNSEGLESDFSAEISYTVPSRGTNGGGSGTNTNGGGNNGGGNNGGNNGGGTVTNDPRFYLAAAGNYNGLVAEEDEVRHAHSGSFTLTATTRGSYSGKMLIAGQNLSIRGLLSPSGRATNVIVRPGDSPLTVLLAVTPSQRRVDGWVVAGSWLAPLTGDRNPFHVKTNPAPFAGSYTLTIPCQPGSVDGPQGHGYGTVKIDGKGQATFLGILADGSKATQRTSLSAGGHWPFHLNLYNGGGSSLGWLVVSSQGDVGGLISWIKPATLGRYYAGGLTNESSVVGAAYSLPSPTELRGAARRMAIVCRGGNFATAVDDNVMVLPNGRMLTQVGDTIKFGISPTTGLFKGVVPDPATGRPLIFGGVILQKWQSGAGMVLGTNRIGYVGVSLE